MKLFIEQKRVFRTVEFWLEKKIGNEDCNLHYNGNEIEENKYTNNGAIENFKPFLSLPDDMANEFIKLIAEYASNNGIKTEREDIIKGRFEEQKANTEYIKSKFDLLLNHLTK